MLERPRSSLVIMRQPPSATLANSLMWLGSRVPLISVALIRKKRNGVPAKQRRDPARTKLAVPNVRKKRACVTHAMPTVARKMSARERHRHPMVQPRRAEVWRGGTSMPMTTQAGT
jgi:hypothetical protein